MSKQLAGLAAGAVVVLGAAGIYFWPTLSGWWAGPTREAVTAAPAPAPQPAQPRPSAPSETPPSIEQPEPLPPQPPADAPALPPLAESDGMVTQALTTLLSRDQVLGLLQTDGFVQRVVATVDNLPSASAAARLWPVNPLPGRFLLVGDPVDQPQSVHPDNDARYDTLVNAVTAIPPAQAAALYRQLYPLFQQAWRELGYPRGEFNTRLLQVLDHLLATPVPIQPLQLTLTEVKGPVPSTTPWLRYEFADPALQSLSTGQRALLRTGPAHQRRLMSWLAAVRQALGS